MTAEGNSRKKIVVLAGMIAIIAFLHYAIPTEPHLYHKIHIVLRKLYFLPPVIAAAWFGLRGACVTAFVVSVLFILHAFLDWPGNYMEQANQVGELAGFWLAAVIPGWLFDRQRSLLRQLARANEETLLGLVSALDLRERHTGLHSQRVRRYTEVLARSFGVEDRALREIGFGALLHDVGKIAVPDRILMKVGPLDEAEWIEMRKHPEAGYQILKKIHFLSQAAEMVYSHHERYDGKGYPRGLKGDEIPLGARLFMVADAYDALTSQRPYSSPVAHEEAVAKIVQAKGSHFDPQIVTVFAAIAPEHLRHIAERYRDTGSLGSP